MSKNTAVFGIHTRRAPLSRALSQPCTPPDIGLLTFPS